MNNLLEFKQVVNESKRIVFFGGAGVSTESGIPDFRSCDGLYNQKYKYPPETILSHTFFMKKTEEFYGFYRDKMLYLDAKPNVTHSALAKLEREGKLTAIVTQNIDGLHEMAGSEKVFNLHGTVFSNHCMVCGKKYGIEAITNSVGIPHCDCGGILKPDVVLYEEPLDQRVLSGAVREIENADTLIVGGTSLTVYPAAGLIRYFVGKNLVLINKAATDYDNEATLLLNCKLSEAFGVL